MKLLLTGDLHLGRTSTRLPAVWAEEARTLTAWQRLVDTALEESVHALLLSGDLIDASNQFWETIGPFEDGVRRLSEAGITVIAICGNHDASVLPAVADSLHGTSFKLLGRGGKWERITLSDNAHSRLHVDGWSFPSENVFEDPTLSYPVQDDGTPVLAMVHGDPGVADSRYAPLDRSRLKTLPVSGWLLGHIHTPSLTGDAPWILMPGSPHPLDPGEPGSHHGWLTGLKDGRLSTPQPVCPAQIRYQTVDIALNAEQPVTLDHLYQQLTQTLNADPFSGRQSLRVTLSGTTSDPESLQRIASELEQADTSNAWNVEQVHITARPPLDIETCSQAGPVQALLAEALSGESPTLRKRVDQLIQQLNSQNEYDGKGLPSLNPDEVPLTETLESILRLVMEETGE